MIHPLPRRLKPSAVSVIEHLETRSLLSGNQLAGPLVIIPAIDPADTIGLAFDLGTVKTSRAVEVAGLIDQGGSDVDWYRFSLTEASSVKLATSHGVVGLYDNSANDSSDLLNTSGNRLLAQVGGDGTSPATITRQLAAGTYFVAVSGMGNRYFHPDIADSGIPGQTGEYRLSVEATALELNPRSGPVVLSTELTSLVVRLNLSQALRFEPTVQLVDANGADVPLFWSNYNAGTFELQIAPTRPFSVQQYTAIVSDAVGQVRLSLPISVTQNLGGEQGLAGNDTPDTAISLGELGAGGFLQIQGTIGDDPYYAFDGVGPTVWPGNDVDLYHFTVTSNEPLGLQAEAFAGRIGSPLDVGLSLYRRDPITGRLRFVAGNDDTYNPTLTADGAIPLSFDTALAAGLSAGDYYIAVSDGRNTPSPAEFQMPGDGQGIFNPEIPHSGTAGLSFGPYVLNLQVIPIPQAPEVVAASITDSSVLTAAPTELTVTFSEFIDLTQQAFYAFQRTSQSTLSGIYIQNDLGQKFFPRLTSFDATHFTAQFLMLDRLPAGSYQLHLSGEQELTNLVGEPLVGNTEAGDYVISFTVTEPSAGSNVDTQVPAPLQANTVEALGVMFPLELQAGINLTRTTHFSSSGRRDKADVYSFEVLQNQSYGLQLSGNALPSTASLQLFDAAGNLVDIISPDGGRTLNAQLCPGKYFLQVGGWPRSFAGELDYTLKFNLLGIADNAPPLRAGPAPAVGLQFVGYAPLPGNGTATPPVTGGGLGTVPSGRSNSFRPSTGDSLNRDMGSNPYLSYVNSWSTGASDSATGVSTGGGNPSTSAVPTLRARLSGNGSGGEVRLIRGTSRAKDSLRFSGLSQLADGPVGRPTSTTGSSALTQSNAGRLSRLVNSALADEQRLANSQKDTPSTTNSPSSTVTSAPPQDQLGEGDDSSQVNAELDQAPDGSETAGDSERDHSQAVSSIASPSERFALDDADLITMVTDANGAEPEASSAFSADQVFATGMGALFVNVLRSPKDVSVRNTHRTRQKRNAPTVHP